MRAPTRPIAATRTIAATKFAVCWSMPRSIPVSHCAN
jgi:hypothetical protein